MHPLFLVPLALALASPALAGQISFDEIAPANADCCYLGEQYAALGVHFVATDDASIWQGLSQGNLGGWGLEGTDGPAFLGFNGQSYSALARFDGPVMGFGLDVSAAAGTLFSSQLRVEGFLGGALVESVTVPLGGVNQWSSVELGAEVDEVRLTGVGMLSHPFGLDNLRWISETPVPEVPEVLDVAIDVLPGSERNPIRLGRPGVIPVVLFGSAEFDVGDVDEETLAFGDAPVAHRHCPHVVDVNGDGFPDLVSHHRVLDLSILRDATEACLWGETMEGVSFEGCDTVTMLPVRGRAERR